MKCPKCGFVSFDHLSECTRCRCDLRAVREGLGFGEFKPEVPSLLGVLFGEGRSEGALGDGAELPSGGGSELASETSGGPGEVAKNAVADAVSRGQDGKSQESNEEGISIEFSDADFEESPGIPEARTGKGRREEG
jgi:hypothetical protein